MHAHCYVLFMLILIYQFSKLFLLIQTKVLKNVTNDFESWKSDVEKQIRILQNKTPDAKYFQYKQLAIQHYSKLFSRPVTPQVSSQIQQICSLKYLEHMKKQQKSFNYNITMQPICENLQKVAADIQAAAQQLKEFINSRVPNFNLPESQYYPREEFFQSPVYDVFNQLEQSLSPLQPQSARFLDVAGPFQSAVTSRIDQLLFNAEYFDLQNLDFTHCCQLERAPLTEQEFAEILTDGSNN